MYIYIDVTPHYTNISIKYSEEFNMNRVIANYATIMQITNFVITIITIKNCFQSDMQSDKTVGQTYFYFY